MSIEFDPYDAVDELIDDNNNDYFESCYDDIYEEICRRVDEGELSYEDAEILNEAAASKFLDKITGKEKKRKQEEEDKKEKKKKNMKKAAIGAGAVAAGVGAGIGIHALRKHGKGGEGLSLPAVGGSVSKAAKAAKKSIGIDSAKDGIGLPDKGPRVTPPKSDKLGLPGDLPIYANGPKHPEKKSLNKIDRSFKADIDNLARKNKDEDNRSNVISLGATLKKKNPSRSGQANRRIRNKKKAARQRKRH